MPLCSFLMPTRNACIESLTKAIESIRSCGPKASDFEILLKVDDDDSERIAVGRELVKGCGKVVTSPRGVGYNDMGRFVRELVDVADSRFCWLFDDDAWVEGDWYSELSKVDTDCGVNAQFYCLGPSIYENHGEGEGCGIIIPTSLARRLPPVLPVDRTWLSVVREKGWHFHIMPQIWYYHDGRQR